MMIEFLQEAILQVLGAVLSIVVTAIGFYGTKFLKNNVFLQNLTKKKEITAIIVKFIEQSYKEIDGVNKLDKAKEEILKWANNIGLKITQQELDVMIESAVKDLTLASQQAKATPLNESAFISLESLSEEVEKVIDSE